MEHLPFGALQTVKMDASAAASKRAISVESGCQHALKECADFIAVRECLSVSQRSRVCKAVDAAHKIYASSKCVGEGKQRRCS
jgi:hypothetical protein